VRHAPDLEGGADVALVVPAAVERGFLAARHGWGPTAAPALANLPTAMAGLHAARLLTPYVTLRARHSDFTPGQLRAALTAAGELIKIRCVRRTLHIHSTAQAPAAHVATRRLRLGATEATARRHGVDRSALTRLAAKTVQVLRPEPLAYRELQDRVAKTAPRTPVEVVRLGIKWAWESGHLVYLNTAGSLHQEQRAFALTDQAYPGLDLNAVGAREATTALVRTYLRAFGPACIGDLLWWSGLNRAEIMPALEELRPETIPVRCGGQPTEMLLLTADEDALRAAEPLPADHLRLTAFEDPTFKGYFTSRSRYVDLDHQVAAFNQIGEVRAAITLGGRIVGTWTWHRPQRRITHELFGNTPKINRRALRHRITQMETFLRSEA
jgi:hypothetical protein